VAMIEDEVKQTRCSTCDADHEYKEARVPPARRRKEAGVLSADVAPDATRVRRPDVADHEPEPADTQETQPPAVQVPLETVVELSVDPENDEAPALATEDDGPVHRRLIRATFPRPEGQTPERREPDFTIRQGGRGGQDIDGNRPSHGQKRHRRPHRGGG